MSELAKGSGKTSEELADFIHKGVVTFCKLFQTSKFDKIGSSTAPTPR
jgi:hypothetical protein